MKKVLFTIYLFFFAMMICQAQKIETEKVLGGYNFIQNDQSLKLSQVLVLLKDNPEAYRIVKSAKTHNNFATVLGIAGGAMVGYPLGSALVGGKPNLRLAGFGAGLLVIGLPMSIAAGKKAKRGVDLYNEGLETASESAVSYQLHLKIHPNGIGLAMNF